MKKKILHLKVTEERSPIRIQIQIRTKMSRISNTAKKSQMGNIRKECQRTLARQKKITKN